MGPIRAEVLMGILLLLLLLFPVYLYVRPAHLPWRYAEATTLEAEGGAFLFFFFFFDCPVLRSHTG